MRGNLNSGPSRKLRMQAGGQAALILIMMMAVLGVASVGVASRSVENLRSSEIESTSTESFKAAESALEVALQTKADVSTANYSATYTATGADGFVSDQVDEGDVVGVSLVGASAGLNSLDIYWNSPAAIMVGVINNTGAVYSVSYYTADPIARTPDSNFTADTPGSYTFKTVAFTNKLSVPITMTANPAPKLVRIKILYQASSIGIEPVGGVLAGQAVTVNATGTGGNNVKTNLVFSKFSDRIPVVFDNVLYTNGNLSQ